MPLDPKAGADPIPLVSGGAPQGIAVDGTHVYWTGSQSQSVDEVPLAGGTATTLASKHAAPVSARGRRSPSDLERELYPGPGAVREVDVHPARRRRALWACCGAALVACGATSTVVVTPHVSIRVTHGGGSLPFDPSQVRIQQAASELDAIAGHPVSFELDVALLPDWREGFEEAVAELVEDTARSLAYEKERRPDVFARFDPVIDRVICRYSTDQHGAWLEEDQHAAVLVGDAHRGLVPHEAVADAMEAAYERLLSTRFADVQPDAVAPADRATYFAWLTGDRPPAPQEPRRPDPDQVLRVLRLAQLVGTSNASLATAIRTWLLARMDDFSGAYWNESDAVKALPATAPWHRAEVAWASWLASAAPSLKDDEASSIERTAFDPSPDGIQTFPGFDPFAFGLMIADRWARAGHPTSESAYYSNVVCPIEPEPGNRMGRKGCRDNLWYPYVLRTDANTRRLAQALVERHDPIFTRTVFRNVGTNLPMWRALEPDEPTWRDAASEIAIDEDMGGAPVSELRRLWRAYPSRRGVILYLLAISWGQTDLPSRYIVDDKLDDMAQYTQFPTNFDGGVTRADFASFLDQGVRAVGLSVWLIPWMTKGWSPVDLLLPHLDAYFGQPENERRSAGQSDPFFGLAMYACKHRPDEFAKLWAYHAKRDAARRPGDPLDDSIGGITPRDCRR